MTFANLPKKKNTVKEKCKGWFSKLKSSINLKFVPKFKNEGPLKLEVSPFT